MKRPLSCVNLKKAIIRLAGDGDPVRLSRALANVVIGQLLPDGVVKGGSSLMFRYGTASTRYTRDLDTARSLDLEEYRRRLGRELASGWNGFTGRLLAVPHAHPNGVPGVYVMAPHDVKLDYLGKPWQTVRVEVGHNEVGDADEFEAFLPQELADAFEQLGFPRPNPLRVMIISCQLAQKLHAVSEPGSERAHDLIDLQLMAARSDLDWLDIRAKCIRLFAYRKRQAWPPVIQMRKEWNSVYQAALETIHEHDAILSTVEEAVAWTNGLISKIESAADLSSSGGKL